MTSPTPIGVEKLSGVFMNVHLGFMNLHLDPSALVVVHFVVEKGLTLVYYVWCGSKHPCLQVSSCVSSQNHSDLFVMLFHYQKHKKASLL